MSRPGAPEFEVKQPDSTVNTKGHFFSPTEKPKSSEENQCSSDQGEENRIFFTELEKTLNNPAIPSSQFDQIFWLLKQAELKKMEVTTPFAKQVKLFVCGGYQDYRSEELAALFSDTNETKGRPIQIFHMCYELYRAMLENQVVDYQERYKDNSLRFFVPHQIILTDVKRKQPSHQTAAFWTQQYKGCLQMIATASTQEYQNFLQTAAVLEFKQEIREHMLLALSEIPSSEETPQQKKLRRQALRVKLLYILKDIIPPTAIPAYMALYSTANRVLAESLRPIFMLGITHLLFKLENDPEKRNSQLKEMFDILPDYYENAALKEKFDAFMDALASQPTQTLSPR